MDITGGRFELLGAGQAGRALGLGRSEARHEDSGDGASGDGHCALAGAGLALSGGNGVGRGRRVEEAVRRAPSIGAGVTASVRRGSAHLIWERERRERGGDSEE